MQIKFEDQTFNISQEMWDAMNAHAAERKMDIAEYIAEAFTKLKNESKLEQYTGRTTKNNNL